MKKKIVTYCCCVMMLFAGVSVFAQKNGPPEPKPNDVGPPGLPIDGGLSYLILAGAAYGVYASRKRVKD